MDQELKRTALFEEHVKLKAKIVPFAGWEMPVSYEGVLAEHETVRTRCGVFDVSHMGQVFVTGKDAQSFVQYLTINDASKLSPGQSQYSAMLNENGGFVDDIFVYRLEAEKFLLCINAANVDKDVSWIQKHAKTFAVNVRNESDEWSQLAVQGPDSPKAVASILDKDSRDKFLKMSFTELMTADLFGYHGIITRTGYTGEVGYELYIPNKIASKVWTGLLETHSATGIKPIGLGARDTLRLESCYLLYGNDMNEKVSPLEAGISWATKMDCGAFIGKPVIEKQKQEGLKRSLVAFKMEDRAIPRHEMNVLIKGENIGVVTSGSVLPSVGGSGGMALIDAAYAKIGNKIEIDVRGKTKVACIVKRPLYAARVKG